MFPITGADFNQISIKFLVIFYFKLNDKNILKLFDINSLINL